MTEEQDKKDTQAAFSHTELAYGDSVEKVAPSLPVIYNRLKSDIDAGTLEETAAVAITDVYEVLDTKSKPTGATRRVQLAEGPASEVAERVRKSLMGSEDVMRALHKTVHKLFTLSDMTAMSVVVHFGGEDAYATPFFNPARPSNKKDLEAHRDTIAALVHEFEHRCKTLFGVDIATPRIVTP